MLFMCGTLAQWSTDASSLLQTQHLDATKTYELGKKALFPCKIPRQNPVREEEFCRISHSLLIMSSLAPGFRLVNQSSQNTSKCVWLPEAIPQTIPKQTPGYFYCMLHVTWCKISCQCTIIMTQGSTFTKYPVIISASFTLCGADTQYNIIINRWSAIVFLFSCQKQRQFCKAYALCVTHIGTIRHPRSVRVTLIMQSLIV